MQIRMFLAGIVAIPLLVVCGCASIAAIPPVDIPFTTAELAPDLTISSVTAQPTAKGVTFTIRYRSAIDRRCSFFNPPAGSMIMEYRDMPANGRTVSVTILKSTLSQVSAITMKFWPLGGGQSGALFIRYADIEPLMVIGSTSPQGAPPSAGQESGPAEAEAPTGPKYTIGFTRLELMSDLAVSSVVAYVDRDTVTFSIGYSSQKQRGLSMFNPPQGAIVKELRVLSVGTHVVDVPVRKSALTQVNGIAVKFFISGSEDSGTIALNYGDIAPLLGEVPPPVLVPEAPVGPLVDVRYKAVELDANLAVTSVTAQPSATRVTFTIHYKSGIDRTVSFYDPPGGSAFKIRQAMSADDNEATVTVAKESLRRTQSITVTFTTGNRNSGSLFLTYDDIQPLLGEPSRE